MDPKVWGPCAWWTLHTCAAKTALSGKRDDLGVFWDMMQSLQCLLPCEVCREHLKAHLAQLRRPRSASGAAGWVYRLHNAVNETVASDGYQPKRADILALYAKPCNVNAGQADLVAKAAPFLAAITPRPADADCTEAMEAFVRGLGHFFDVRGPVPAGVYKTNAAFKRWLGVKNIHIASCSGTCTQKGGC